MRDYEPDVSQILALYQQLEDDIISSMTKRMLKMGKVSEATKYEAEILQSSGLLYEDILNLIAQRTDAAKQHVKALFKDAGVQTVKIDNQVHTKAGAVPIAIRQDLGMKRILEAGYRKTLKTMRNLVNTTANMVQTAFISACDRAYMQVSSGAFSYQQAIRQAVKSFAAIGATVKYPSGHTDRLDVAVRRAVLTGVGQTSAMVAMERAKQADCYLMELTAHSGSRPEHAVWQGQLVSLTGKDVGKTIDGLHVFSLEQIGYQTGAGFKGWNCRHNWHPYYVGYSIPNYTKEQLAELDAKNIEYNGKMYSEYEISQMQRAKERKVRALKRQCVASHTALENAPDDVTKSEMQADYSKNAVKLKSAEKQLREFCKQTGRRNDTFRTQVDGFGRSQAQKAVWREKNAKKDLTPRQDSDILKAIRKSRGVTDKHEKSREILENSIGFIVRNSFYQINPEISEDCANQLLKLEKKFGVVRQSISPAISSESSDDSDAYVKRNSIRPAQQELVLCKEHFSSSREKMIIKLRGQRNRKYCMPFADGEETIYDVTHEYGHMLQNILMQKRIDELNLTPGDKMTLYDIAKERVKLECRKQIIAIAKSQNPDFKLSENLSTYGKVNNAEFFAEVFANSQLGTPNELGKAMNIWLERKGLIK